MIQFWQIALITVYAFLAVNEKRSFNILIDYPITAGMFTGLIMGNPETGLFVGGTLQLMTLGVNTYGGMSVPNTTVGAIIGTALSVNSTPEAALAIAIPVALFMIQLDIIARSVNVYFVHAADRYVEKGEYDKAARQNLLGMIGPGLSRAIPVALVLALGSTFIDSVMAAIPQWFMTGLQVAGGIIPVVGICILLTYLPTKSKYPYLFLGYLLLAYFKLPMIAVAGVALVIALIHFAKANELDEKMKAVAVSSGGDFDE